MKGLLIGLVASVVYAIVCVTLSHFLKPERHSKLFFPALAAFMPVVVGVYLLTPADLGFLAPAWQATHAWLDIVYACVVLAFNMHTFIDIFFGLNGGFSMSILLELLRTNGRGLTSEEIVAKYFTADGMDKLYGWRLPRLAETGYIRIDPQTDLCTLTAKGRKIARLTDLLKRGMNLGAGG